MSWRDKLLPWGIYLLMSEQIFIVLSVLLMSTIIIQLDFLSPIANTLIILNSWLDLFGFLMVGIGFHALGRFFDDEDLKTQARTIGILIAFWSVPMFMFRASLQILTGQKNAWYIIRLALGVWNFESVGVPVVVIQDLARILWAFSVWWPVLLIVRGITDFGLIAIPFFIESVKSKIDNFTITCSENWKKIKLFFISTAVVDLVFFVILILSFQPLTPTVTDGANIIRTITNEINALSFYDGLDTNSLFLFTVIWGMKSLIVSVLAFITWFLGYNALVNLQKELHSLHLQKRNSEEKKTQNANKEEKTREMAKEKT